MKAGAEVYLSLFLAWALYGGQRPTSRPDHLIPNGRAAGNLWTGGWNNPTADLDISGNSKIYSRCPGMEK